MSFFETVMENDSFDRPGTGDVSVDLANHIVKTPLMSLDLNNMNIQTNGLKGELVNIPLNDLNGLRPDSRQTNSSGNFHSHMNTAFDPKFLDLYSTHSPKEVISPARLLYKNSNSTPRLVPSVSMVTPSAFNDVFKQSPLKLYSKSGTPQSASKMMFPRSIYDDVDMPQNWLGKETSNGDTTENMLSEGHAFVNLNESHFFVPSSLPGSQDTARVLSDSSFSKERVRSKFNVENISSLPSSRPASQSFKFPTFNIPADLKYSDKEYEFGMDHKREKKSKSNFPTVTNSFNPTPIPEQPVKKKRGRKPGSTNKKRKETLKKEDKSFRKKLKVRFPKKRKTHPSDIDPAVQLGLGDDEDSLENDDFDLNGSDGHRGHLAGGPEDMQDRMKRIRNRAPRSKNGCWTCRLRRKRCPEQRPVCSECVRLGLECDGYTVERPAFMRNSNAAKGKMEEIKTITLAKKKRGSKQRYEREQRLSGESPPSDGNIKVLS
ncbi:hypothetical protein OGAPHI_004082 [Ogataea philodendri]|uniref:Zn(2)-C6 fungal-type domain-containing protein n=1 Tax=Ogataea philodendri TaxID=1378263 RepID=A0A9P8P5I6_9ASCO|nr:uncharacterized protein OGAPHI_004082 [Ogataea philodendri]KAH3665893.1 hypothetical protein OGAPHI_004082 [Ogataea philodendri]